MLGLGVAIWHKSSFSLVVSFVSFAAGDRGYGLRRRLKIVFAHWQLGIVPLASVENGHGIGMGDEKRR